MLKNFGFLTFVLIMLSFISCTKEDRKEVKQTIDSASQKLGHELDTIINTRLKNDSLFNNAPVESVNGSTLKSKEFRSALNDIFDKYEDIKDELSDDDTGAVRKNADDLKKVLSTTVSYAPQGEMDKNWKLWISTYEKVVADLSKASGLAAQRKVFSELTRSMENLVKQFGLDSRTIYKLTCKALPDNSYWLTDTKELDNPYAGKDNSNGKDEKCVQVINSWKFE